MKRVALLLMLTLLLTSILALVSNIFCLFSLRVEAQFEEWVPYVPDASQVVFDYWKQNGSSYMDISIEFPSTGYNVSDWGTLIILGNNISADAEIWRWTGASSPVVITKSYTYSLGNLPAGEYLFTFKAWGFPVKNTTFTVFRPAPVGGTTISIQPGCLPSWLASTLLIISVVIALSICLKRKKSRKKWNIF